MDNTELKNYFIFLELLNMRLAKFFAQQAPYLHCKEGCSHCCKNGEYPCSELEFLFLKIGFEQLEEHTKNIVIQKTLELKKEKEKQPDKVLSCECPFLINDRCSVYFFRPIICRTFGIPHFTEDGKLKVPFCRDLGLNYSNVYDEKTNTFTSEKFKASGISQEPLAYNLGLKFLIGEVGKKGMKLDFGDEKTITDFMIDLIK